MNCVASQGSLIDHARRAAGLPDTYTLDGAAGYGLPCQRPASSEIRLGAAHFDRDVELCDVHAEAAHWARKNPQAGRLLDVVMEVPIMVPAAGETAESVALRQMAAEWWHGQAVLVEMMDPTGPDHGEDRVTAARRRVLDLHTVEYFRAEADRLAGEFLRDARRATGETAK